MTQLSPLNPGHIGAKQQRRRTNHKQEDRTPAASGTFAPEPSVAVSPGSDGVRNAEQKRDSAETNEKPELSWQQLVAGNNDKRAERGREQSIQYRTLPTLCRVHGATRLSSTVLV